MAGSEPDIAHLLERISLAISVAMGDAAFNLEIATIAARKEADAIREETGVDFVLEDVGGKINIIVPFGLKFTRLENLK